MTNTLDTLDPWRLQKEWLASDLFFRTYCHLHIVTGKQFLSALSFICSHSFPPQLWGLAHQNCTSWSLLQRAFRRRVWDFLGGTHWIRIHLPTQGIQVRSLVQEDSTCHGATKLVWHSYWACKLQILKSMCLEPVICNKRRHRNEKPMHCNQKYSPLSATRESLHKAMNTQHSQQ